MRLNPVVAKLVDRRIVKREELHRKQHIAIDATGIAGSVTIPGTVNANANAGMWPQLLPLISQGDHADQRIGNSLAIRSFSCELTLRSNVSEPFWVRVIIASSRQYNDEGVTSLPASMGTMQQNIIRVNASDVALFGSMENLRSPVATENFRVHWQKWIFINNDHVTTAGTDYAYAYKWFCRTYRFRVASPKYWRYGGVGDTTPNNFAPLCFISTHDPNAPLSNSSKAVSAFMLTRARFSA